MFLRSLLASAVLALSSAAMAATTVIPASQVANVGAGRNQAGAGFLTVNWSDGAANIGLIQFDLSAYAGQTVQDATLSIFHQYNVVPGAVFDLYANTSAWTTSISGDLSQAPSFLPTPVAEITISDDNWQVWRSADLTAIVNDWTHGVLPNDGLTLERVDQANPVAYFTSGLAGTPAPRLTLSAVPEPTNVALLLAGLAGLGVVARRRARA